MDTNRSRGLEVPIVQPAEAKVGYVTTINFFEGDRAGADARHGGPFDSVGAAIDEVEYALSDRRRDVRSVLIHVVRR